MKNFNTAELINYVAGCKKTTPTKAYVLAEQGVVFEKCEVFGSSEFLVVFGDKKDILLAIKRHGDKIKKVKMQYLGANFGVSLADPSEFDARIEPFAVVREGVKIGKNAIIMMGAVLNIGANIGENTMIDMNAVVGSNAQIGKNCHVGAGAVVAGVLEPIGATPVVIEDGATLGANSVVLEGVRIGKGAVIGAGAVVTKNVAPYAVAVGCPAVVKKFCDQTTARKTKLAQSLRNEE